MGKHTIRFWISLGIACICCSSLMAQSEGTAESGKIFSHTYPGSDRPGKLKFPVEHRLWLPPGVKRLRGIIVHQHGCGAGACKGGQTAADDLHWQALARKWDCALLGPAYTQDDKENCRLWCDPRNGSGKVFLDALEALAGKSGHPELTTVPWCLWGHSGGGFWASLMQTSHPDRIVAIWYRSGTAFQSWTKGEIPAPELSPAVYGIPIALNPGLKEKDDKRFSGAWTGAEAMFQAYRGKGAPAILCPDPKTGHECGDSRYLAIPFFDACLALRLPPKESPEAPLRPITSSTGWIAPVGGGKPVAADSDEEQKGMARGPATTVWLPSLPFARAWEEFNRTGMVGDGSPPPAPGEATMASGPGGVRLAWKATADLESGLGGFVILRDGKPWKKLPEKPAAKPRSLFQGLSYHDTPEQPVARMETTDPNPGSNYSIQSVNGAGLPSTAVPFQPVK
jgi:hypothetical protein